VNFGFGSKEGRTVLLKWKKCANALLFDHW